jgi:hypothetical protein
VNIHPLRARDVLPTRALSSATELTAPNWPKTPPENRRPTTLDLLSEALLPRAGRARVGVAEDRGRPLAYVLVQPRSSGLVWDVERLAVSGDADVGVQLVRWACDEVLGRQGRRVFLETPESGAGSEVASRSGFELCTRGAMYVRPAAETPFDKGDAVPARPRLRSDEMGLFQLYNAVVPAPVRAAEALDYEEWAALHRGNKRWAPSLTGAQDYVWEMGSRLVGWMHIVYGDRAQFLTLLIHPQADAMAERMLRDALGQLSTKVPVLVDAREYQGSVVGGLQQLGFALDHDYEVWVKQLAQRVPEAATKAVTAQPAALA